MSSNFNNVTLMFFFFVNLYLKSYKNFFLFLIKMNKNVILFSK